MKEHILPIHQFNYKAIPRNKDQNYTITNSCEAPQKFVVIDHQGYCYVCPCEAWLPIAVGHITEMSSLEDIWNSSVAKELSNDINQGKFTHCAVERCGVLDHNIEFYGYEVGINIDPSCNLVCPSCRSEKIMLSEGKEFEQKKLWVYKTIELLEKFDKPVKIIMSGNGDVLASHIMRPLISSMQPKENHSFRIFTNGLLIKKHLEKSHLKNYIDQVFISIDAGSKDVYENVRRPGKWETLIENLDFLKELTENANISVVQLRFILQDANYKDMQNFVDLCKHYNFTGKIDRLENWGSWRNNLNDYFDDNDVIGNDNHKKHQEAAQLLSDIYTKYKDDPTIIFNSSFKHYVS